MLTKEKSQMIVIEGSSGEDLQQRYNADMDELTRIEITIEEELRERRVVNAADTQGRTQEAAHHTDLAG